MAHGKTLEMKKIQPKPSWKCICGLPYESHRNKNGAIGKRYEDTSKHRPITGSGMNREQRRKLGIR
ncbi:MAG: hypothetical protein LC650_01760 [Actinobacteria bacterium]|nr:hypothetical protein [Actinomycetota bacterium]